MLNIGTIIANLKLVDTLTPALNKAQSTLKKFGGNLKQSGATMRAAGSRRSRVRRAQISRS